MEPRRTPQGRCTKQQTRLGMKIAVPYSPQPQASYYKSSKLKPKVRPPYQTIPKGNLSCTKQKTPIPSRKRRGRAGEKIPRPKAPRVSERLKRRSPGRRTAAVPADVETRARG